MKTINIEKRRSVQSSNEICMGNGKRIVIKSKRNSSRFFAETNRFLTKCLVVLNAAYIDLLREYRLIWLITTNTDRGKKTYYLDLQQKVKSNLDAVDFVFEKFNATWGGSNDPFFAFIDLKKIASFLREAAEQMAAFHKKRNTTASIYVCMMLAERCTAAIKKLQDYGE